MINKTCQRCKTPFSCQSNDIQNCSCRQIVLSDASKNYLAKTNYDCLCNTCLKSINEMQEAIKLQVKPEKIEENRDYYSEKGLIVFTEYYHIKRGYCCKNNCRHCAYGFEA